MKKIGSECRKLQKKNNKDEEAIYKENNDIYTNMIVYLRTSKINGYNQELVRQDLIQMILDGQERGDNIEKVIGGNYKEVCDEIIESMPKETKGEKLKSIFKLSLTLIWIIGIVVTIESILSKLVGKSLEWNFTLTVGELINGLVIIILANLIVTYICKTAFEENKNSKAKSFLIRWIVFMAILVGLVVINHYFNYTILNIPIAYGVIGVGVIFVLDKIISIYIP
ncbi:MAG: hypothetical protein E7214_01405 [Clostridium sp.]|nr:hypothetical protein [Clostridium sp.]